MATNDPAFTGHLFESIINTIRDATAGASSDIAAGLLSGVAQGTGGPTDLHFLLAEISREAQEMLSPTDRLRIHQQAGLLGQQSTLASYDSSRGRSGGPRGYRAGEGKWPRYSGGALRKALASSDFFEVSPDGIQFINADRLNNDAKQWARLNFGAEPAGEGSLPPQTVMMGDTEMGQIGLNESARPAFQIPKGIWRDGAFHPFGEAQTSAMMPVQLTDGLINSKRDTKGIRARNFLDRGLYTMMTGKAGHGGTSGDSSKALPNLYLSALESRGSELARSALSRTGGVRPKVVRVRHPRRR